MLKQLASHLLIVGIVGVGLWFLINPPRLPGPRLKLKEAAVQSVELSMFSTQRFVTGSAGRVVVSTGTAK